MKVVPASIIACVLLAASAAATAPEPSTQREMPYETVHLEGHVVWLAEALERQLGVQLVREAHERVLALETDDGEIIPILEDQRGRSFRTDPRLRHMHVQLLVRRYRATPGIQIVRVYEMKEGAKYEIDYWCDVCSIAMYEKGPCSCCQDANRLRKRVVDQQGNTLDRELKAEG